MDKEFVPTIKVVAFKRTGKYYACGTDPLKPEHYSMFGFELTDLIKKNDPSIRDYCCVTSGFHGEGYYFVIEVDYGLKNDFCYFLFDPKGRT